MWLEFVREVHAEGPNLGIHDAVRPSRPKRQHCRVAVGPVQEWDKAVEKFEEVMKIYEGDKAAKLLKERCIGMKANPPPSGWDGCEVLNQKHF